MSYAGYGWAVGRTFTGGCWQGLRSQEKPVVEGEAGEGVGEP